MEATVSKMEQKPSPWQQGEFAGACDDGDEVGLSGLKQEKNNFEKITWNLPMVTRNRSSWFRGLSNPSGQRHLNSLSFIEIPVYLHCFVMAVRKQSCKQMS